MNVKQCRVQSQMLFGAKWVIWEKGMYLVGRHKNVKHSAKTHREINMLNDIDSNTYSKNFFKQKTRFIFSKIALKTNFINIHSAFHQTAREYTFLFVPLEWLSRKVKFWVNSPDEWFQKAYEEVTITLQGWSDDLHVKAEIMIMTPKNIC